MKKVAFFGGSFDPIHLGHLNLAIEIFEKSKRFDEILFCPTNISPFKLEKPPKASSEHRLNMLKIALKNAPFFKILSLEIKRDFPSYTIDTLNLLKDENDLNLIVTEESLEYFHLWKEYENILKIAPLIVGTRKKNIDTYSNKYFSLESKNFIKTNIFEISSTQVRDRLKNKKYCKHLVQEEVLDYIYKNQLYL